MTELINADNPDQPTAEVWFIPKRVWLILLSWGLAVFLLAGLFSFWTYRNQRQQDHDMCVMTGALLPGPEPTGDSATAQRSRAVRTAIRDYRADRGCDTRFGG